MKIVIKVGTSTLAYPNGSLNIRRTEELCKVMSDLKNAGHDIILVTSGAIGMGAGKLQLSERPRDVAAKQAAEAAPEAAEAVQPDAAKPELLDFLAGEPEAENDPFADQPTKTAPELPELTPAQELAGYIRARSAAALITPHALLLEEVENADELLAQMPADPQCTDIVTRAGAKDTYYYSNANMSDNYAMIAQLIEDKDLCVMFAEMVRFNARIYPSATPLKYFQRSPYGLAPEVIEQTWKAMQENPEYADIEELTNNQNERFLFSTKHLTRRYAKAISDVDDFCD